MAPLLLALLTLEHLACGVPLLALQALTGLLEVWQRSIYRRLDVMVERAKR